jgi:hypothetical protein
MRRIQTSNTEGPKTTLMAVTYKCREKHRPFSACERPGVHPCYEVVTGPGAEPIRSHSQVLIGSVHLISQATG